MDHSLSTAMLLQTISVRVDVTSDYHGLVFLRSITKARHFFTTEYMGFFLVLMNTDTDPEMSNLQSINQIRASWNILLILCFPDLNIVAMRSIRTYVHVHSFASFFITILATLATLDCVSKLSTFHCVVIPRCQ